MKKFLCFLCFSISLIVLISCNSATEPTNPAIGKITGTWDVTSYGGTGRAEISASTEYLNYGGMVTKGTWSGNTFNGSSDTQSGGYPTHYDMNVTLTDDTHISGTIKTTVDIMGPQTITMEFAGTKVVASF